IDGIVGQPHCGPATREYDADPLIRRHPRHPMPDTALLTQPSTPIVQTHDLSVHYEDRAALGCVNIPIYPGETVGLLGPNGAGKSTLLKVIAGMLPPSHGHVTFRGEEITGSTPCITYVPQRSDADWTFPISVLEATML